MRMEANGCEEELRFSIDNYHIVEQVRRGKSTSDFVVLHGTNGRKYAMKKIFLANLTEKLNLIACLEMKVLSELKNPYIVQYKDSWVDKDNNACIFTAYCEGGNMANAIKKARGRLFPEERIFKWLAQLLLAVNYLHSNRILHMDLTCSNIFLPKDDHIQLGNYGLAKLINPENPSSLVSGIANSMCPEVLDGLPYGYKSDIWSLGCCMYEITAQQPAFKAQDKGGLMNKINRSLLSPLPIVYSSTLKQLIKLMLRKKPEHRPTACELLRNPCLQPYLLQFQNMSSIYLPVYPTNSPQERARRNSTPSNLAKEKVSKETSEKVSRSLENLYPSWSNAESGSSSSSQPASSTNGTEEKPETKRIDPSYDPLNTPEFTCDPEISLYPTEKQTEEDNLLKEMETIFSRESLLRDVDLGVVVAQEVTCHPPSAIKEAETQKACPEPRGQRNLPIASTEVAAAAESDCLHGRVEVDEAKMVKLTETEMSSVLSKLSKLGQPQSKERADALECLLEKCAGLVKAQKYEELAGLLIPFGEDGVSARDTAIWFAKTLLSSDKLNHGN
ncbi:unnamed protein product [Cochlearia groenlandica]